MTTLSPPLNLKTKSSKRLGQQENTSHLVSLVVVYFGLSNVFLYQYVQLHLPTTRQVIGHSHDGWSLNDSLSCSAGSIGSHDSSALIS